MEPKLKDLTGRRFGRLKVLRRDGTYRGPEGQYIAPVWECICDCGKISHVPRGALISGNTQSCGCLKSERVAQSNRTRKREGKNGT